VTGGATGTLGAIVEDAAKDQHVLSCNHVIGNENKGIAGDDVWSPGPLDGGTNHDKIGVLHNCEPVQTGGVHANLMDAAVAK
jgi:hypothetical protein